MEIQGRLHSYFEFHGLVFDGVDQIVEAPRAGQCTKQIAETNPPAAQSECADATTAQHFRRVRLRGQINPRVDPTVRVGPTELICLNFSQLSRLAATFGTFRGSKLCIRQFHIDPTQVPKYWSIYWSMPREVVILKGHERIIINQFA